MRRHVPLALLGLLDCSNTPQDTCDAACMDVQTAPPISGGGCDASIPYSQGGCAVNDSDGFFVSPMGSDTANGGKATPFQTVQRGITAAEGDTQRPNVYVCAGSYPENVTLQGTLAGVALHGGFDCASWTQVNAMTTLAPPYKSGSTTPQYVATVNGVAVLFESIALTAPDATDPGVSSIAIFSNSSVGLTLRRAVVVAGKGSSGATPPMVSAAAPAMAGNLGGNMVFAPAVTCTCGAAVTIGGQGGGSGDGGVSSPADPEAGAPIINGQSSDGQPGSQGNIAQCSGGNGANGLPGAVIGTGAQTLGALTTMGWQPANGGQGSSGGIAQGGAGGWWTPTAQYLGGGGGGCGGCGGSGGLGGQGGGASIALAAVSTTMRVRASTLRAAAAGDGGNGGLGQPGQPGGAGGIGSSCNGGMGGTGGTGAPGGGGAGGVSIAIATVESTPDIDSQSTLLAGTAGQGGHDASALMAQAMSGVSAPVRGL